MFKWRRGNVRRWRPHWTTVARLSTSRRPPSCTSARTCTSRIKQKRGRKRFSSCSHQTVPISTHTHTLRYHSHLHYRFVILTAIYCCTCTQIDRNAASSYKHTHTHSYWSSLKEPKCRAYVNRTHLELPSKVSWKLWFINRYSLCHWLYSF